MRIVMDYGRDRLELTVADTKLVAPYQAAPAALADPGAALEAALAAPFDFPPLRHSLTPGDHVAVVVDEETPALAALLGPLLHDLHDAGVEAADVTLLCPPGSGRQPWLDDLPDAFADVRLEVHDPADRKRLAYLATTGGGRRLYLARTLVDADQVVILARRRYDLRRGPVGAVETVFPAFCDQDTRAALADADIPAAEAAEALWLLGLPFVVEVIPSAAGGVARVVAGAASAASEGRRELERLWRRTVPRAADLVVATLSGPPEEQTFADLAAAAAAAAHVVRPDGRIVLLSGADPELGAGAVALREADGPEDAPARLRHLPPGERVAALAWARAAGHARLALLSGLREETVEGLFAAPLDDARPVQRLLDAAASCVLLPDAHRMQTALAGAPALQAGR